MLDCRARWAGACCLLTSCHNPKMARTKQTARKTTGGHDLDLCKAERCIHCLNAHRICEITYCDSCDQNVKTLLSLQNVKQQPKMLRILQRKLACYESQLGTRKYSDFLAKSLTKRDAIQASDDREQLERTQSQYQTASQASERLEDKKINYARAIAKLKLAANQTQTPSRKRKKEDIPSKKVKTVCAKDKTEERRKPVPKLRRLQKLGTKRQ